MKNENIIFQVLSNLNHSGTRFEKGQFFEGNYSEFGNLVNDGVLRVVHGAESIEEAKEIVAKESETAGPETSTEEKEPENTWGPKPDEIEIPKEEVVNVNLEEYKGEMGNYKITGVAEYTDETGVKTGELEIGSIQNLPKEIGQIFVEKGVAEEVTPEASANVVADEANKPAPIPEEETGANL